ncbi:unnamed protein product [Prorocentrum cordatum]|uniref:Uncharacterized protein n=1 Tax=Prorocentrum cordatum TaxID=2364126 RepID=A0ABN9U2C1_9DINO|nr:unnamed protein product [Polarella glacialis]
MGDRRGERGEGERRRGGERGRAGGQRTMSQKLRTTNQKTQCECCKQSAIMPFPASIRASSSGVGSRAASIHHSPTTSGGSLAWATSLNATRPTALQLTRWLRGWRQHEEGAGGGGGTGNEGGGGAGGGTILDVSPNRMHCPRKSRGALPRAFKRAGGGGSTEEGAGQRWNRRRRRSRRKRKHSDDDEGSARAAATSRLPSYPLGEPSDTRAPAITGSSAPAAQRRARAGRWTPCGRPWRGEVTSFLVETLPLERVDAVGGNLERELDRIAPSRYRSLDPSLLQWEKGSAFLSSPSAGA